MNNTLSKKEARLKRLRELGYPENGTLYWFAQEFLEWLDSIEDLPARSRSEIEHAAATCRQFLSLGETRLRESLEQLNSGLSKVISSLQACVQACNDAKKACAGVPSKITVTVSQEEIRATVVAVTRKTIEDALDQNLISKAMTESLEARLHRLDEATRHSTAAASLIERNLPWFRELSETLDKKTFYGTIFTCGLLITAIAAFVLGNLDNISLRHKLLQAGAYNVKVVQVHTPSTNPRAEISFCSKAEPVDAFVTKDSNGNWCVRIILASDQPAPRKPRTE